MKSFLLFISVMFTASCTHLDNYMLGNDNTPKPEELKPLPSKANVVEKWSVSTSHGSQKQALNLKLKPVIAQDVLYTASPNGVVQAFNKKNGETLWTTTLPVGLVSGPALGSDCIALGTDASTIMLLNRNDGQKRWQANVSSEVLSRPTVTKDKLIAKTVDGNLYAFDLKFGKKQWVMNHGAPGIILKASSSPVVVNGELVLVGYADGKMDAVDLQTGHLLWQRSIAFANGASDVERLIDISADPIVYGGNVYFATYQGYVGAISLKDGEFLWKKPASVYKDMTLDDQSLYLTDSEDVVWSFNRLNGQVNWKQTALKARGLTEPVLSGNHLIIADATGLLHVIATSNGDLMARTKLNGKINTAPQVSGSQVYVMTDLGRLSRFSVS